MKTQTTPYLLLSDFDRTIAETFRLSPNGVGVDEACAFALVAVFGVEVLPHYVALGGLGNRAPGELVRALTERESSLAQRAVERHPDKLTGAMAEEELAELLVRLKLYILLQEIGPEWPKPCTGFRGFAETLQRDLGSLFDFGIVSSGHEEFISQTMTVWGVNTPAIMVTDDDVRLLRNPEDSLMRVKPARFPFDLAIHRWRRKPPPEEILSRVVYLGDDLSKDGGLALNVGIPFGLFTDEPVGDMSRFHPGSFQFNDWEELAEFISEHKEDFEQSLPCAQIFCHFEPR